MEILEPQHTKRYTTYELANGKKVRDSIFTDKNWLKKLFNNNAKPVIYRPVSKELQQYLAPLFRQYIAPFVDKRFVDRYNECFCSLMRDAYWGMKNNNNYVRYGRANLEKKT